MKCNLTSSFLRNSENASFVSVAISTTWQTHKITFFRLNDENDNSNNNINIQIDIFCFVLITTTTTKQQQRQQQYGEHTNWHFFRFFNDGDDDGASFWVKVQTNVNRASSYRKCKKVIIIIFDVNSAQPNWKRRFR